MAHPRAAGRVTHVPGSYGVALPRTPAAAYGVDTAYAAASDLSVLAGAAGFTAGSPLVKAIGDLAALRYADGIHDSLYRAVLANLTHSGTRRPLPARRGLV